MNAMKPEEPILDVSVIKQPRRLTIYEKRDQEFNNIYDSKIKELRHNKNNSNLPSSGVGSPTQEMSSAPISNPIS